MSASNIELTARYQALQEIGVLMMRNKDPAELLSAIVRRAIELMSCDAASLYLKKDEENLVFEIAVNQSIKFNFQRHVIPLDRRGIANFVFKNNQPLRLDDVYEIPAESPYEFNRAFDEHTGYRTKSVLACPLATKDGASLGVIQLINRKDRADQSWPIGDHQGIGNMPSFTEADESLLTSFASIASSSLENAKLYQDIESLMEGFVKAAVSAIESRDIATRGHSERVAALTVGLAEVVDRSESPKLKTLKFSRSDLNELRYAALLHDFGKIGVSESTLLKQEKLSPEQKTLIQSRILNFRSAQEIYLLRRMLNHSRSENRAPTESEVLELEADIMNMGRELDKNQRIIDELCKPSFLTEDRTVHLSQLRDKIYFNLEGKPTRLLEEKEVLDLSTARGSLTPNERVEIEMHVTHTYRFLEQIPWTKNLRRVPEIAYSHHEKLDGTGYPRKLLEKEIPPQSQIMTIADIFDALVTSDRSYKPAIPFDEALRILEIEAKSGKINGHFLEAFIEGRVFLQPAFLTLFKNIDSRLSRKAA